MKKLFITLATILVGVTPAVAGVQHNISDVHEFASSNFPGAQRKYDGKYWTFTGAVRTVSEDSTSVVNPGSYFSGAVHCNYEPGKFAHVTANFREGTLVSVSGKVSLTNVFFGTYVKIENCTIKELV
jgi:hypothetical protein